VKPKSYDWQYKKDRGLYKFEQIYILETGQIRPDGDACLPDRSAILRGRTEEPNKGPDGARWS
jgi:hypothetical protein